MNAREMLAHLQSRRSVRAFRDEPVERAALERLVEAAASAPSNTNRQPWRFTVVTQKAKRQALAQAVRRRVGELKATIARGHHSEDFGTYGEFFYEPLETAPVVIWAQYRVYPDLIAGFLASGGGDPAAFHTAGQMQAELSSASAAVMALLLQAHAEGLGACWMTGPLVAKEEVCALLGIEAPWQVLCAVPLGHPAEAPDAKPRKPLARVVEWVGEEQERE
jgi:nitroreductase